MTNIRLIIEYNGAGFYGWQRQPGLRTIQSELERVLQIVLGTEIRSLTASGRTDAGVHARGQVCNFWVNREVDLHRLKHSVSSIMRNELAVLDAQFVREDFNSCRDAVCKQYSYTILNRSSPAVLDYGRVWHISRDLQAEKLKQECKTLIGVHDFKSFQASGCSARTTIKEIISSELCEEPPYLIYRVVGRGFLKQMIRNIVGSLVALSDGKLEVSGFEELIAKGDRRYAGPTAPAHGLTLDWVRY